MIISFNRNFERGQYLPFDAFKTYDNVKCIDSAQVEYIQNGSMHPSPPKYGTEPILTNSRNIICNLTMFRSDILDQNYYIFYHCQ